MTRERGSRGGADQPPRRPAMVNPLPHVTPFRLDELDGLGGPGELATARALEVLAGRESTLAGNASGFTDGVMARIASEPTPAPARLAVGALRRHSVRAFLISVRDAWRVTMRPGVPPAVRAQALALVLVVAGLAGASSLAAASAMGLLDQGPRPSVPVVVTTPPPTAPVPSASPDASLPVETEDPSSSPEESEAVETAEPGESEDSEGSGGGTGATSTPHEDRTSSPTRAPTAAHEIGDDNGGTEESAQTPRPTSTPRPTATPKETQTPGTGGDGGSGGDGGGTSGG